MVPPCSARIARVPAYSSPQLLLTRKGLSPSKAPLSIGFRLKQLRHRPDPRSLATTSGVSIDVLSSRYLDVSVPWVCLSTLCIRMKIELKARGFPIRRFTDQSLFAAPRNISQRTTSFIASRCQGIHQTPLSRLIVLIINAHPPRIAPHTDER